VANADINPDDGCLALADREVTLDFDSEGDEPPVRGPADGCGEDAGGSLLQAAS
jgi:hypothetical protein